MARAFNLSAEKEAQAREDYAKIPDAAIAEGLAVMIAQELRMDAATHLGCIKILLRCYL